MHVSVAVEQLRLHSDYCIRLLANCSWGNFSEVERMNDAQAAIHARYAAHYARLAGLVS